MKIFKQLVSIFGIRREERIPALVAGILFVALNALMIMKYHERFTLGGNIGFWSVFSKRFLVSGYDMFTYMILSRWGLYYSLYRHPLLAVLLYPAYLFNSWQMEYTSFNMAVYIMGGILVFCAFYSFIFIYRVLREIIELKRNDSLLLTAFFFSFGHVMLTVMVPDHFCMSMFLLTFTMYVVGRAMKNGTTIGSVFLGLVYLVSSGITLTNGVKILLAGVFSNGKRFFSFRSLIASVVIPTAVLGGIYLAVHYQVEIPTDRLNAARLNAKIKKDSVFAEKLKKEHKWVKEHMGEPIADSKLFAWTDMSTSRWKAVAENLFGESIQLHQGHLLEDTNRTRPVYVSYKWWWSYVVEAFIVLLFVLGIWCGWRSGFFRMCLSWFGFDMLVNMVIGFGIMEVYIMSGHWIFIIPVAIGFLFKYTSQSNVAWLRGLLLVVTLYLWIYNGTLITSYMLR
ncbi:DUF6080 domain-containing protein [Xylanibacter muris]|uniref:Uncharacterized protein n=1 Tax=Xylanibacter muris TaxID=2736290 RepID=A0ABX2AM46_9BACT|nr:DUF6080 domain-containing protein [Xylanibacter muris]NPD91117.1 hypothetical protein [Xylanibacter muris]